MPDTVRLRPKTILAGDPVLELLRESKLPWMDQVDPAPQFTSYINRSKVQELPGVQEQPDVYECYLNLRPRTLDLWLQQFAWESEENKYKLRKDNEHEDRTRREDGDSKTISYA